jgi:hypothetical protein
VQHSWPLSVISDGYRIQWNSTPRPWFTPPLRLSTDDRQAATDAVHKFLDAGIIEVSPTQSTEYLSNFFTIQEATKRRPILDCRQLNQFVQCNHFRMEGIPALRDIIEKDDLMCKLNLKDAYVVVPIHQESRKFLSFKHEDCVYQYKSLAFGLSVAPRIFTKPMRYAVEPLRQQGIRLVCYLDDICLLAKSPVEMQTILTTVITHLTRLGFLINWKKSILQPFHQQEFLGFRFNSRTMKTPVPQPKINKLLSRIKQLKKGQTVRSCRWIASLLEKITSMIPAIGEALLHIRYLQRDVSMALKQGLRRWESACPLSEKAQQELLWWERWATTKNGLPIQILPINLQNIDLTIHVDVSQTG